MVDAYAHTALNRECPAKCPFGSGLFRDAISEYEENDDAVCSDNVDCSIGSYREGFAFSSNFSAAIARFGDKQIGKAREDCVVVTSSWRIMTILKYCKQRILPLLKRGMRTYRSPSNR